MKTRCTCGAPLDSDSVNNRCNECITDDPNLLDEPNDYTEEEVLDMQNIFPDYIDSEE